MNAYTARNKSAKKYKVGYACQKNKKVMKRKHLAKKVKKHMTK